MKYFILCQNVILYENKFIVFIINSWSKVKEDTFVRLNLLALWNSIRRTEIWKQNILENKPY